MLLNRLVSIIAVFSLAGSALAAPLPRPLEKDLPGGLELEVEHESDGSHEIELESNKIGPVEVEVGVGHMGPGVIPTLGLARRLDSERSMAGSVLAAQNQLDVLKPQLEQAMLLPLGSIEKTVGPLLGSVHSVVQALSDDMKSFVGANADTLYGNPSGSGQLTDAELAKSMSVFLLGISDIEETVQHVSGFAVTSAQQNIRNDLLSMKTTLGTVAPLVQANVANIMAMATSLGVTGIAGVTA
ncbi:hypothetical protein BDV93DRAFT_610644 [Ceratobasidium sp. AG-I]|nr:hypothetical protein BDV93DRAFT_610644 [Ceratobasidium sp. AG-I]